jgi:hypothetical protein
MEQYNSISIKHTSANRSPAINRAEEAVSHSVERFELAMQQLAERIEDSRIRVESAVDHVNKARTEVTRIKDSVVSTVQPFKGYALSVGEAYTTVRSNPRPYLLGVLGVVGALLAWTFYQGREDAKVFDTTLDVHPTYQ